MDRVAASRDHQVARPRRQLAASHIDGGQRGGTGGVHGEVQPAQVVAVRHPTGDDVHQDAGEAVLGPLGELAEDRLVDVLDVVRQAGTERVLGAELTGATTGAQDDAAGFLEGVLSLVAATARIQQHAVHEFESQQLNGLDRTQRRRRDAVLEGIEEDLLHEATATGVDLVALSALGVVPAVDVEAVGGHLSDQVALLEDVAPELLGIVRPREHAGHTDDRDVQGRRRGGRRLAHLRPGLGLLGTHALEE